ncbi:MAG: BACON domain-containing protein [Alistipes sp.]|jgi:uncharacterized membrane protein (DUF2068 family)|nr:BACON domain-containing protein [Alistipes sp.]
MKRILTTTFAALAALAMLTGCPKPKELQNSLTVTPTTLAFASGDITAKTVAVTTDAREWSAKADVEWITLMQEGAALVVAVNVAHIGTEPREGSVTVTAGNAEPKTVTVTQQATQSLSVSPSSLHFASGETGSKSVTVTTNAVGGWKATYPADWFEVSSSADGRLVVTVDELWYGGSSREGTIDITAGNAEPETVTVTQSSSTFTFADIKYGTYTATGTPSVLNTPGARSWSGSIRPNASGLYYELTNFGDDGITVRLKFSQGKIYVDSAYKADEYGYFDGYLRVAMRKDGYIYYGSSTYLYEVDYDMTTRTLDFGGTASFITASGTVSGDALVGVMGFHESTGDLSQNNYFTDMYKDLRLSLTFNTRAAAPESAPASAPTMKSASGLIPRMAR